MSELVSTISTPIRLEYTFVAGRAQSRFLRALTQRRLVGQRCPQCRKVYFPPRGSCTMCGLPTEEEVELPRQGTVTTFCIVNLPAPGQTIQPPYVCGTIQLDGADTPLFHLVGEVPPEDVRIGMRVEAVWVEPEQMGPTLESIRYFRPVVAVR